MTNKQENFPIHAFSRFSAKARLHIKKKLENRFTNTDIALIDECSHSIFSQLLKVSRISDGLFVIDEYTLTLAINCVWFAFKKESNLLCQ